jgi:adenylate kinase family enzyme
MMVKRIAVTGPAGAGKSQLAEDLGDALAIRVLHLDALFWKPGWVPTPQDEFEAMQRREVAADAWVVEAQYDDLLPEWFAAADTVVFVDSSLVRSLWRVGKRRLNREGSVGTPIAKPGALHRSLLKFARNQWRYRTRVRREVLAELERERDGRRVVILPRGGDTAAVLRRLDSPSPAGGTLQMWARHPLPPS